MSEIERLEQKIDDIKSKYESDIEVLIAEINALKKEPEVKPVFPAKPHCYWVNVDGDNAMSLGMSRHTAQGRLDGYAWLEARAYIIEEINKANKGDNGFKIASSSNYMISFYYGEFEVCAYIKQGNEKGLYFRDRNHALDCLKDEKFAAAYKTYLDFELE